MIKTNNSLFERIKLTGSFLLLRLLVDIIYVYDISLRYNYMGFSFKFSTSSLIYSLFAFVLVLPLITTISERGTNSDIIMVVLFCLSYIPATTMFAYKDTPFSKLLFIYWLMLLFLQLKLPQIKYRKPKVEFKNTWYWIFTLLFFLSALFVWGRYAKFRIHTSLFDVYEIRLEARTYKTPIVINYLFSAISGTIPLMVIYSLFLKNYLLVLILFITQIIVFFVNGSKFSIFNLILSISLYFIFRKKEKKVVFLSLSFSLLSLLGMVEKFLFKSTLINSRIIRRIFFVPSNLNYYFYEFFKFREKDVFRQSILRFFKISSPYEYPIARIIGELVVGNIESNANNGLFSDAFSNLGIVGIFIMPFLIVIILRIIDFYSYDIEKKFIIGVLFTISIQLISGSFFTLFLTKGLVYVLLLMRFLPKKS